MVSQKEKPGPHAEQQVGRQPNSFQSAGEAIYPLRRSADRLALEVAGKAPVFGESVTPRFAEMGCSESRPNPAGNETGAHQAVDRADDAAARAIKATRP